MIAKRSRTSLSQLSSPSKFASTSSVADSFSRGKAAIAQAEKHIEIFEELYMQSQASIFDKGRDKENIRVRRCEVSKDETVAEDCHDPIVAILQQQQQQQEQQEQQFTTNENTTNSKDVSLTRSAPLSSTELLSCLIKDGEMRMKRDQLISSERVRGNFDLTFGLGAHDGLGRQRRKGTGGTATSASNNNIRVPICSFSLQRRNKQENDKPRKIGFDPKNLSAARRAMIKVTKVADDLAVRSNQDFKQFKARALPNGGVVQNNPYALTKAAIAKRNPDLRAKVDLCGDDTNDEERESANMNTNGTRRLDASIILGDPLILSAPAPAPASTRTPQSASRGKQPLESKKCKVRKDIYSATTNFVARNLDEDNEEIEGGSEYSSENDDLVGLHQQIAKLHAELEIKRKLCFETIHALEEETQCASIKDIGIPELEKSVCESVQNQSSTRTANAVSCSSARSVSEVSNKPTSNHLRKQSVYTRQKAWLENLERKKKETKEKEDNDIVKNVTGKPDLELAKESWCKAKEEHDDLFKSAKETESSIQKEKREREKRKYINEAEETDKIQALAKEKKSATKMGVDRKLQNEYVDKLSRPNKCVECVVPKDNAGTCITGHADAAKGSHTSIITTNSVDTKTGIIPQGKKENRNDCSKDDKEGDNYLQIENETDNSNMISFADMNDTDFAKMIKKIEVMAKKEVRKKSKMDRSAEDETNTKTFSKKTSKTEDMSRQGHSKNTNFSPYKSKTT